ncbi:MAG TPA: DedA family protein [Solirubrobacteraceae bacterium]|nr:DedA family protein [Solirubrobacteraceae bacterium]
MVDDPEPERTPRRPWDGRAERADRIVMAGLAFSALYGVALLPLVPSLVGSHPALLELLRGSITSMIAMGAMARTGHASLLLGVVAGVPGCIMFDWLYWWAGRRWGWRAVGMLVGAGRSADRRARRLERVMEPLGPFAVVFSYLLPIPNPIIDAAVGWTGMRLWVFLLLDAIGAALWVGLMVGLGYAIGQPAVDVVHVISRYALWVTLGIVAVIVAAHARGSRRLRGA